MRVGKLAVHLVVLTTMLFLTLRPSQALEPVSAVTVHGSIQAVTGELRRLADDALAAGDQVLHNRIEQALNGLTLLLRNLEPLIKSAQTAGNEVVNNAARESVSILSELHADGSSAGNFASAKLNLTLANASALMSSIPFVDVPPAVGR